MDDAKTELVKAVEVISKQIAKSVDSSMNANDALKYTQAMLNAAHVMQVLKQVKMKD